MGVADDAGKGTSFIYRRVLLGPSILASPSSERQASSWVRLSTPQHRGYAADIGGPALGRLPDRRRLSRTRTGPRHRRGHPRPRPGHLGRPTGRLGVTARNRATNIVRAVVADAGRPLRDPGPRTGRLRRAGRARRLFAVGARAPGRPGRRGGRGDLLARDRPGRADRARRGGRNRRQPLPDRRLDDHRPPRDRATCRSTAGASSSWRRCRPASPRAARSIRPPRPRGCRCSGSGPSPTT